MKEWEIKGYAALLEKKGIEVRLIEYCAGKAGSVQANEAEEEPVIKHLSYDAKIPSRYVIRVNSLHDPNTQFATIAHELAHIYLGHLGKDPYLKIPKRARPTHELAELEDESVSYIVYERSGVHSKAEAYLVEYVYDHETVDNLDFYAVLKAAGQVESALGLGEMICFGSSIRRN